MADIEGFLLFCDDVREEVGNKNSFMGICGPKILLSAANGVLPSICAVAICRVSGDASLTGSFEVQFLDAPESAPPSPGPVDVTLAPPEGHSGSWSTNIIGKFVNLPVAAGMRLRSILKIAGESFEGEVEIAHVGEHPTIQ